MPNIKTMPDNVVVVVVACGGVLYRMSGLGKWKRISLKIMLLSWKFSTLYFPPLEHNAICSTPLGMKFYVIIRPNI